jgi:hypothetical protein
MSMATETFDLEAATLRLMLELGIAEPPADAPLVERAKYDRAYCRLRGVVLAANEPLSPLLPVFVAPAPDVAAAVAGIANCLDRLRACDAAASKLTRETVKAMHSMAFYSPFAAKE